METAAAAKKKKSVPPFPTEKHWLFGSGYLLRNNVIKQVKFFIQKYGEIFSLSVPTTRIVIAAKPEYARYVLVDNNKNYTKSLAYDLLKILLGNGLVTSEGDFWRKQRRLIQPAFHKQKLEALTNMMIERANYVADKFEAKADSGGYFDISPYMTELTLDIISKAMFSSGVEEKAELVGRQITLLNQYSIEKLNQPIRLPGIFPTPFNVRERKALQILNQVVFEIIDARRKSKQSQDDLLSMLIDMRDEDTGEAMDDQQLRDEVMTIFVAGNETSSNALSWTLYLLSQNPEAEQKMVAEIDRVIGNNPLSFINVNQCQYVRQVIEESMRIYPPVWSIGRRTIEDDEIGGYLIKKGTNVLIPIIYFHHNPAYWQNPESFEPERFAPEKKHDIDRYVYFPFGGGPRLCIGNNFALLEMQIILIAFYRRFRFQLKPGFIVEPEPLITLRPKNGVMLKALRK